MKKVFTVILGSVIFSGLLSVVSVRAEETGDADAYIEVMREYAAADKKQLIIDGLTISGEELTPEFWSLYNDYQNDLRKVNDKLIALIKNTSENYFEIPENKPETLLNDYLKIQDENDKLRKKYVKKFRKQFPEKFVVKYFQLENKISAIKNFILAIEMPLVQ